jgi:hypothetical protein
MDSGMVGAAMRFHAPKSGSAAQPLTLAERRGTLPCSEPGCTSVEAVACAYVDRRQRECNSAWCRGHQQIAFNGTYCRRHAGIIQALGPDHVNLAMPDLENRAPSLANWVGRDLDAPFRALLEAHFPGHTMNVTSVVSGGSMRERTWGRSWKLISGNGVDLSVNVNVPEADDSVVRVVYDGRVLAELTPPWIEARRHGVTLDAEGDEVVRRRFYDLIIEDVEAAMLVTKNQPDP